MNLGLLIAGGLATLMAVVTLVLDLTGITIIRIGGLGRAARLGPGQRLTGAGVSLVCGTVFLTEFARYRHWPGPRSHHMFGYLMPVMLVAMTLIIAGAAVHARSRRHPAR